MKKILLIISSLILGIILGVVFSENIISSNEVNSLMNISRLENMVTQIYKTGDIESSIIALNYLADTLYNYDKITEETDIYITDRGFAHGRLFFIYKKQGKDNLAQKEYEKAIKLLGKKYEITSQKDLIKMIRQIDSIGGIK